jgi:hypothetical protein
MRLHDLRHTWATLTLQAGIHPKVVSERLGHITLAINSHVAPALQREAAEVVASKIFGWAAGATCQPVTAEPGGDSATSQR